MGFTESVMKEFNLTEDEAKKLIAGWLNRRTAKDEMIERYENGEEEPDYD